MKNLVFPYCKEWKAGWGCIWHKLPGLLRLFFFINYAICKNKKLDAGNEAKGGQFDSFVYLSCFCLEASGSDKVTTNHNIMASNSLIEAWQQRLDVIISGMQLLVVLGKTISLLLWQHGRM